MSHDDGTFAEIWSLSLHGDHVVIDYVIRPSGQRNKLTVRLGQAREIADKMSHLADHAESPA